MADRALSLSAPALARWRSAGAVRPRTHVTMTADDRTLVDRCLAGESAGFDLLVERHRRQVYQVCYRFVGNHEDASDLTQEAFLRAYRSLHTFKGTSAFSTWLYRIAVNVSLNRVSGKAAAPAEPIDGREHQDTRIEHQDESLLRTERAAQVRAAIAGLPRKQRATMILRLYHELPHDRIAEILGSSVGAVKANFFHALANVRKRLQERGE